MVPCLEMRKGLNPNLSDIHAITSFSFSTLVTEDHRNTGLKVCVQDAQLWSDEETRQTCHFWRGIFRVTLSNVTILISKSPPLSHQFTLFFCKQMLEATAPGTGSIKISGRDSVSIKTQNIKMNINSRETKSTAI